jgi:hypothetical protein
MKNYSIEIQKFYNYLFDFYHIEDGIYPIASTQRIVEAANEYLESKPLSQIYFDSLDRESVRKIIEPSYSIFI